MESARIRLEQGRLYEMLIKHDLFEGVDAIPEAVAKVQKELKEYIVERLEILLGMRAETQKQQPQQVITPPQFNDVEVQALKMVAAQVTKGASKNAPTTQVAAQAQDVQEQKLNSIKEKPKSLNRIQAAPEKRPAPVSKPAAANFGVDIWTREFNEDKKLFDKRYKPSKLQYMPDYPKRYSLTGEFIEDGPYASNAPIPTN
jgi:hypothetical protein